MGRGERTAPGSAVSPRWPAPGQLTRMFWGGASPCRGLHEKGGKRHDVPAHHGAEEAVEEYGRRGRPRGRESDAVSEGRPGGLSGRPRGRRAVLAMIKRRAAAAGRSTRSCHRSPNNPQSWSLKTPHLDY